MTKGLSFKARYFHDGLVWKVVCRAHGTEATAPTRVTAMDAARDVNDWCSSCAEQPPGTKRCARCNDYRPLAEFRTIKNGGYSSWCRPCNAASVMMAKGSLRAAILEGIPDRACATCGETKPAEKFRIKRNNVGLSGVADECLACEYAVKHAATRDGTMICLSCKLSKPEADFPVRLRRGARVQLHRCSACLHAAWRENYERNRGTIPERGLRECKYCHGRRPKEEYQGKFGHVCPSCRENRATPKPSKPTKLKVVQKSRPVKFSPPCQRCGAVASKGGLCHDCYKAEADNRAAVGVVKKQNEIVQRLFREGKTLGIQELSNGELWSLSNRCTSGKACVAPVAGKSRPLPLPGRCYRCATGHEPTIQRVVRYSA